MNKDSLGDRMKFLEGMESDRRFMPNVPVIARLDGKGFSKFTKGLERPYDIRMSKLMLATTIYLVEKTGANCGYCQSDEISLLFYSDDYKSQIYFDGRIQKMTSVLASECSVFFNVTLPTAIPEKQNLMPIFDCRVWQVPSKIEAMNHFLWREQDATKNSISMAARHYYSHKELMNVSGSDKQEMLMAKGVNWNNYPSFFKRGSYVIRRTVSRKFSSDELNKLPIKHAVHKNSDLEVTRKEIVEIEMPPLNRVANAVSVLFDGEEPIKKV